MPKNYKIPNIERPLSNIAMALLALFPILHWYDIGLPIGLGDTLMAAVSLIIICLGKNVLKAYPKTFFIVWAYIALNWYFYNFNSDWKGILPGGIVFFIFAINIGSSIYLFDISKLNRYMRIVSIMAIGMFLIQFFVLKLAGEKFCLVPCITSHFLYENLSYSQLVARQLSSNNPCAFFLEKSYMAYYLVIYLCLELFFVQRKHILFSKLAICIIITLFLLQSGSGLIGMIIPVGAKFCNYYWQKKSLKYIMIFLSIPLVVLIFYMYTATEIGSSMLSRQEELYTEGTSGYSRIILGYTYFSKLYPFEQIFGTSVAEINNLTYLSYLKQNFALNGIQAPLIQLGIVGLSIWILFYTSIFVKTTNLGKVCIFVFLWFSAIEVTYMGAYMILLTIIPCAEIYKRKKFIKGKNENSIYINTSLC